MGALSGVEMGLEAAGVPHKPGGVLAAMESLGTLSNTKNPTHSIAVG
jgi:hypothetical protein